MNALRMLFHSSLRSSALQSVRPGIRTMAYCGTIDMPDGPIRYGFTTIIDFSGTSYLVPYTCKSYVDDIDGFLNNLICDIPKEEYNDHKSIMETVINQNLFRRYSRDFHVHLYPAAKSISPPCYKMV
jgi:hypothetical protein